MVDVRAYMSFGGGVQSTAIAMLAISRDERLLRVSGGVLPELYVFADTGDEPEALYPHVADMRARIEASGAAFRIVAPAVGKLSENTIRAALLGFRRADSLPFWVAKKGNRLGPIKRGCTGYYKVIPIRQFVTRWFGVHRCKPHDGSRVQAWLGLSADEPQRLKIGKIPRQTWAEYFNPLAEMGWHRADCANFLNSLGITARRSACVFCPYHSKAEWRAVRANERDWARACAVDDALEAQRQGNGAFNFRNPLYLTPQGVRLRDADFSDLPDPQANMFAREADCAGVCGV